MDIRCLQCSRKVSNVTKRRKFCSQRCADAHRYTPRPPRGKWIKCAYCKKKVWTPPWRFKFRYRFCNQKHAVLFAKKKAFRKKCLICGKVFFCQPYQVKYCNRRTCSKPCGYKLVTLTAKRKRIKNGYTKHQIDRGIRYSKEAQDWRKAIFERDNYTCVLCRARNGRGKNIWLEADHIKPFAYFPELRFDLSNGRTLCRKCHDKTKISAKRMREIWQQH